MTSKEVAKCDAVDNRRRSPLDHLPPPANSNKPLTPFSIEDILNKPSVKRSYTICGTAHLISSSEKHRPSSLPLSSRALLNQTSPLCALEELASKTFKGLEVSVLQAAEGKFHQLNKKKTTTTNKYRIYMYIHIVCASEHHRLKWPLGKSVTIKHSQY